MKQTDFNKAHDTFLTALNNIDGALELQELYANTLGTFRHPIKKTRNRKKKEPVTTA